MSAKNQQRRDKKRLKLVKKAGLSDDLSNIDLKDSKEVKCKDKEWIKSQREKKGLRRAANGGQREEVDGSKGISDEKKMDESDRNRVDNGSVLTVEKEGHPSIVAHIEEKVNTTYAFSSKKHQEVLNQAEKEFGIAQKSSKEPKNDTGDLAGGLGGATARERAWQRILQLYPEANFLQSPEWAEANRAMGHRPVWGDLGEKAWCLMLVKNAKRGRYLEVPGGPLLDWQDEQAVTRAFVAIREVAQHENCVFVRLRPQLVKTPSHQAIFSRQGAKIAPMHLHAEHTVILDLTQSEEDLLKKMRRQTRYEVRQAAKKGVQVEWGNSEDLYREFHSVQHETALRQHFVPPNLATLLAERQGFGQNIRIYVARDTENQPIAYGLIFWSGKEGEYFEAASTDLNRKLPGSYAIIWQAMQDLKELGLERFNLWGIAPPGETKHRYSGVTTFKTGFGGEVVEYLPAQDLIICPARYKINLLVEKMRKKWRHL